jgi:hypothetical protein
MIGTETEIRDGEYILLLVEKVSICIKSVKITKHCHKLEETKEV